MKNWILGILVLICVGMSLYQSGKLSKLQDTLNAKPEKSSKTKVQKADPDLPVLMLQLQAQMEKLYFSLEAGNSQLASYLLDKMEATFQHISNSEMTQEGVDVSHHAKMYGVVGVREFKEKWLQANEKWPAYYQRLVQDCNGCHLSVKRPFIKIQKPTVNRFSNQFFTP